MAVMMRMMGTWGGILIFAYGGVFLRMSAVEARNREPGMMLPISLAITVSFVYSLAVGARLMSASTIIVAIDAQLLRRANIAA